MSQLRLDGSDGPDRRSIEVRIKEDLLEERVIQRNQKLTYRQKADLAIQLGIYKLEDTSELAYKAIELKIAAVERSMRGKDGCPLFIPDQDQPGQTVLFEVGTTKDRRGSLLQRGLQTLGHHRKWKAVARRIEELGEQALPVAEFMEGVKEILATYRLEWVVFHEDNPNPDKPDHPSDPEEDGDE